MKNKTYTIAFHIGAEKDFDTIHNWYELQEPELERRFSKELYDKLAQILENPETYGIKAQKGYREAILKNFPYSIVYKILTPQNVIFISSIHHHSFNPKKKFRK